MTGTTFGNARVNVQAIQATLAEINRVKFAKRDYIYPASQLSMRDDGRIVLGATQAFQVGDRTYTEWKDAELAADCADVPVVPIGTTGALELTRHAEQQLATRLGIPLKFIDSLRTREHSPLAAHNFTTLLAGETDTRFLVRTLDGRARAILSNSYRVVDNYDLFFGAAETLQTAGATIWNARIWDNGFEMMAVDTALSAEVIRQFDDAGGRYHHAEFGPDIHNAAIVIRNSETGAGAASVEFGALRAVCNNTVIFGKSLGLVHLGKRNDAEGLIKYKEDTLEAEGKTLALKVRDAITSAFDRETFTAHINRLSNLTAVKIEKPEVTVAKIGELFNFTEERRAKVLAELFKSRDLTQFGAVQAVTWQAHEAPAEEASRLERAGGEIAEMDPKKFLALSA